MVGKMAEEDLVRILGLGSSAPSPCALFGLVFVFLLFFNRPLEHFVRFGRVLETSMSIIVVVAADLAVVDVPAPVPAVSALPPLSVSYSRTTDH